MKAVVRNISEAADGIRSFRLESDDGTSVPDFEPGAHVDVAMPDGTTRQYSLINAAGEGHYQICVNLDANSRGGSRYMHEAVVVGGTLEISAPRNNFPLIETAPMSVLIAGGIGITPILAMVRRLSSLGRGWRLYHCTRNPARTPFVDVLQSFSRQMPGGEVVYVHDAVPGIRHLDIPAVVAAARPGTHFYCCGPEPMLDAFGVATAGLPREFVHVERFSNAAAAARDDDADFELICKRSGLRVPVPAGQSILEALEAHGLTPLCSCREGICGTCETRVLAGEADHRDAVLSPEERQGNQTMMICVSRARGRQLTLDI